MASADAWATQRVALLAPLCAVCRPLAALLERGRIPVLGLSDRFQPGDEFILNRPAFPSCPVGLWVGYLDGDPLALSGNGAGFAPGAVLLSGPVGIVHHPPDGVGADVRQPIGRFTQCPLQ